MHLWTKGEVGNISCSCLVVLWGVHGRESFSRTWSMWGILYFLIISYHLLHVVHDILPILSIRTLEFREWKEHTQRRLVTCTLLLALGFLSTVLGRTFLFLRNNQHFLPLTLAKIAAGKIPMDFTSFCSKQLKINILTIGNRLWSREPPVAIAFLL